MGRDYEALTALLPKPHIWAIAVQKKTGQFNDCYEVVQPTVVRED